MIVALLGWETLSASRRGTTGQLARRLSRQAGSATVLAVGVVVAGLALVVGALDVARVVATSHRAAAAADLAALAAAARRAAGEEAAPGSDIDACAAAARVAELNAGSLDQCALEDRGAVTVVVSVVSAKPWPRRASGRARAGSLEPDARSAGS